MIRKSQVLAEGWEVNRYSPLNRTGFSNHGDYVFGWKGDSLQRALDSRCANAVCKELKTQTSEEAMKCTKPMTAIDPVDGCKTFPLP